MNPRQMQYVLKIAELQSISKAANELYLSQPALSQYIQRLEEQLGVQLFDRSTQPLKLTYAGERYLETARNILDLNNQFLREIDDITDFKKGSIKLGVPLYSGAYLLPVILPSFQKTYPGAKVILVEKHSDELEECIIRGEVDFAIINSPMQFQSIEITSEPLFSEEILLALPPNHAKLNNERINLLDFQDKNFILQPSGTKLRHIADTLFKQAGFKPRILMESKNIITVHHLVMAGLGITFIPETLARFSNVSFKGHYYHINESISGWTLVIGYKKGRHLSILDKEFFKVAKQIPHKKL